MDELIKEDNNQPLVPVFDGEIGGVKLPVVDGRTLHRVMGVKRDFTNWMKRRIEKYQFQEGVHYLLAKIGEQLPSGTKYSTEYTLSLNMAKELSMVEPTEMGCAARKYFIECERKLNETMQQEPKPTDDMDIEARLSNIFNHRTLFWAIEKRDLIAQPGVNKEVLYSVMLDIQDSLSDELNKDLAKALRERKITDNKEDWIKFIKRWVPIYFRNTTKPNILKLVTNNDEINKK